MMRSAMRRSLWGLAALALAAAGPASGWAEDAAPDLAPRVAARDLRAVRGLAIQHGGRHKPLESFARETLDTIIGSPHWQGHDAVATLLSMLAEPDRWQDAPLVSIPFVPLREPLGLSPKTKRVSYNELVSTRKLMRMLPAIVQKQERDEKLTMLEQETMDAFQRFASLAAVFEQRLELVPPRTGTGAWSSIQEVAGYGEAEQRAVRDAWAALVASARGGDAAGVEQAAQTLVRTFRQANAAAYPAPWQIDLELAYHRVQPFAIARIIYGAAFLLLLIGLAASRTRLTSLGGWLVLAAALVHAGGMLMRVVVGGRPPVSNFFETMLWLPFVGVVLALVFERIYRAGYFALGASFLAAGTLCLADVVPLDSSITPVVAVLRSNLWLTIHVLTIVASYGALALATVLAHVYGGLYLAKGSTHPALAQLTLFQYRAIQVGVVLLAGGIMLGAVWANASWGRYWGWDPKETWALITLLWFLAALHGRFVGWVRGPGLAMCTIAGFFLLLVTYYGVSFYLVGLHSYAGGNPKPFPPLLIGYLIAELLFLAVFGAATWQRRRATP